jgi:hypothetical protein
MFKFLFFAFLLFLLLIFMLGFSFVRTLGRVIFGVGSSRRTSDARRRRQESEQRSREASKRKKVFGNNEGEYVDYEEVKVE